MNKHRAVVIGAGIAGLSAAHFLSGEGIDVLVLEKEYGIGGRCKTFVSSGYCMDTGAQFIRDSYDRTLKSVVSLGYGEHLRFAPNKCSFVRNGKFTYFKPRSQNPFRSFPWGAIGLRETPSAIALLSLFLREYRRFDIRFPDRWNLEEAGKLEAFSHLIYGSGLEFLDAISRFALGSGADALSYGACLASLRMAFADHYGSFSKGTGMLVQAFSKGLKIMRGIEAVEVVMDGKKAIGVRARPSSRGRARTYHADIVVCAVPSMVTNAICPKLGIDARRLLRRVKYSSAIVSHIGVAGVIGAKGPVIFSRGEGFNASWLCTHRSKSDEIAPYGHTLITVVFSNPDNGLFSLPDEKIIEISMKDASRALPGARIEPVFTKVFRHERARPIFSPGYSLLLREFLQKGSGVKNLFLVGDYCSSPTIEGAFESGHFAAKQVISAVGS